jgi:hypothetical protein
MLHSVNYDLTGSQEQPSPEHAVWGDVRPALQTVPSEDRWFLGWTDRRHCRGLALDGIPEPLGKAAIRMMRRGEESV